MSNQKQLRVVFMGTPDFSVPTLEALIKAGHSIVGVYCQPDKQKGRGKQVQMPPVKVAALNHNLPVFQPVTLRDEQVQAELEALNPDVVVVIAYGKILPPWLIRLPQYGCINVHASILPKYRGAAPIHYAILMVILRQVLQLCIWMMALIQAILLISWRLIFCVVKQQGNYLNVWHY